MNRRRRIAMKNAARRNRNREFDIRKFTRNLGSWALTILIAAIAGYSLIHFGFQTITVIGQSMNSVLESGDQVVVNKAAYTIGTPKRYDIVAFQSRKSDEYYNVKRVIGLPGETVKILDGHIFINDVQLTDAPFQDYVMTAGIAESGVTLDDNEYFLMGDNCNNSEDSRFANVGNVLRTEIIGKVVYRISPADRRGKIESEAGK